jgi:hypothetical protein
MWRRITPGSHQHQEGERADNEESMSNGKRSGAKVKQKYEAFLQHQSFKRG